MKRPFSLLAALAAAVAAGAAAPPAAPEPPVSCTIASKPTDAALEIDGLPAGATPASVALAPGRHVARLEPDGSPATFVEFEVAADRANFRFDLPPPAVPVLLDSEPRGATVSRDGFEVGVTPMLLPDSEAGRHVFSFKLAGYRDAPVEVSLAPDKPVRLAPALVPTTGSLDVSAEPEGARVFVGGVPRGVAPLVVSGLPEGETDIRIEAPGHRPFAGRAAVSAGRSFAVSAVLEPLPGSIRVVTAPAGATVFLDDRRLGTSPVTARDLPAGPHRVRLLKDGFDPVARTVRLELGEDRTEEFSLVSAGGSIRVVTVPAGVEVRVDGVPRGRTEAVPGAAADAPSAPLLVDGLKVGTRVVAFSRPGWGEASAEAAVAKGKTTDLPPVKLEKLFLPDFLVETSVRTYKGVFIEKTNGVYRVEIEPGVIRSFPANNIVRVDILDPLDSLPAGE